MTTPTVFRYVATLAGSCLLSGCLALGPSGPPTRLYLLQPLSDTAVDGSGPAGLRVEVGPVLLAGYLERPDLVTRRDGGYELLLTPLSQWAEPLEGNVARVLRSNLATLLDSEAVLPYPWRARREPDFRVRVAVERFDQDPDGEVGLDAQWWIGGAAASPLVVRRSRCRETAADDSVAARVAAQSRALACLSREIAVALRDGAAGQAGD